MADLRSQGSIGPIVDVTNTDSQSSLLHDYPGVLIVPYSLIDVGS
jgi:hypothetical protein